MKWINNRNMIKVFKDLGEHLHDEILEMSDVDLFYDRMKFMRKSLEPNEYESNDNDDIYEQDINTISIMIAQLIIFNRIIMTDYLDEPLFPKGSYPSFMNMVDKEPNHSTGEELKTNIQKGIINRKTTNSRRVRKPSKNHK
jgi:hypothetical protein